MEKQKMTNLRLFEITATIFSVTNVILMIICLPRLPSLTPALISDSTRAIFMLISILGLAIGGIGIFISTKTKIYTIKKFWPAWILNGSFFLWLSLL